MKSLILASLLLLPLAAHAADDGSRCAHSQPRNLQLDLAGVDTVVFDIGGNDLDLRAGAGAAGRIDGRACASDEKHFDGLVLEQRKTGGTLFVRTQRDGASTSNLNFDFLGIKFSRYAYMHLKATLPNTLSVKLKTGSGDASVDGVRMLDGSTGSGDLTVSRVQQQFSASAGSGDIHASDVGSLDLKSIGSGDATIKQVRGASKVGHIGSGDLEIRGTRGPVEIGSTGSGDLNLDDIGGSADIDSIGSGDVEIKGTQGPIRIGSGGSGGIKFTDIGGDVNVGSIASGDLNLTRIDGNVTVGSIGSGDLYVNGARGNLTVRSKGSGDIDHRNVGGRIDLPKTR